MKPEYHLVASAFLGLVLLYFTKSPLAALMCFLSGFLLIDLDHFFDFWVYKKKITFSREFFEKYCEISGKIYIFFHSFELILLLWVLFAVFDIGIVGIGIIVGLLSHLVIDLLGNGMHPLGYFLTYRVLKGFDFKHVHIKEGY
ncbi:hypothetical protein A3K72_02320 [Candidatus Woesearchaeota archaeon RBG_13_36_6]|nr:MAG: hypothetical protein A3K72_02320 [Candidatus Woesearchaeota archaeon RBG_13_36_6]